MKPIKLMMKGFGPYADEVTINFYEIEDSIFLIAGPTGAGKTTIFDAMCFALYGETTGGKSPLLSRCDKLDDKTKTEVEFTFSHNGAQYTAHREMRVKVSRDKTTKTVEDGEVWLSGDGIDTLGKKNEISKKVEEIIGLTAEQFKQIIVLPQGQFRSFLESNSEKKNEILGKLFDTSKSVGIQNRLKIAASKLEKKKKESIDTVNNLLSQSSFVLPEDMTEAEKLAFKLLPDCSNAEELGTHLDDLIKSDEEELNKSEKAIKEIEEEHNKNSEIYHKAELENRDLDDLENANAKVESLSARAGEFSAKRAETSKAKIAYEEIYPFETEYNKAKKENERLSNEKRTFEQNLADVRASLAFAENEAKKNDGYRKEIDSNNIEISNINRVLPIFDHIDADSREIANKKALEQNILNEGKALSESLKKNKADLENARNEFNNYNGVDERWSSAKQKCDDLSVKYNNLKQVKDFGFKAVAGKENNLNNAKIALSNGLNAKKLATDDYAYKYELFLNAQAGIIANDIKSEIDRNGETSCKVCGTRLTRANIPSLAMLPNNAPTKEMVDAAKAASDRADKAVADCQSDIKAIEEQVKAEKDKAVVIANNILGTNVNWETLSSPNFIDTELAKIYDEGTKSKNERLALEADMARRDELSRVVKNLSVSVPNDEKRLDDLRTNLSNVKAEISSLSSKIESEKAQLGSYTSKADANARGGFLVNRNNSLATEINKNDERLKALRSNESSIKGSLETTENNLAKAVEAEKNALAAFNQKLDEWNLHIVDINEYNSIMNSFGGEDPKKWIENKQKEIQDYDNDLGNWTSKKLELLEKTKDFKRVDVEALLVKLSELKDKKELLSEQRDDLKSKCSVHYNTAKDVKKETKSAVKFANALGKIEALSDAANGKASGKLTFETYAIGQDFKLILEEANKRLVTLSDGRYELVHQINGENNRSKSGLDIDVLDNNSSKQRPSKTLSGGEGFLVSLSLALGLSDVVQSRAGGNKIDAMFIDEGFGTLDDEKLDSAVGVLKGLTSGDRMVGIISHVDKLESSINSKLLISTGKNGSSIELIN